MQHKELNRAIRALIASIDPRQFPSDTVLMVLNFTALVGWLLLVFLPRNKITLPLTRLITTVLAFFYALCFTLIYSEGIGLDFFSIQGIKTAFNLDIVILLGWVHYLAFDLFVGRWILIDSQEHGLRHAFVVIPLLLTFMLGPIGYIFYFGIRFAFTRAKRNR